MSLPCSPSTHLVAPYAAEITLRDCSGAGTTLSWNCPATATVGISAPTTVDFTLGCTRWTGTSQRLPTITAFPSGSELQWIEQDGEDDGDDNTTSCRLWFFFTCISWNNRIGGWRWNIRGPAVIIGPPPIKWPKDVSVKGRLPGPWPPITIDANGRINYPTAQPTNCETQSAEICSTSTFISTTVSGGTTRTVTSRVTSTCNTIRGCVLTDGNYDTTSTLGSVCRPVRALRTNAPGDVFTATTDVSTDVASPTLSSASASTPIVSEGNSNTQRRRGNPVSRAPPSPGRDHVMIWPRDAGNRAHVETIKSWLQNYPTQQAGRQYYDDFVEVNARGAADNGDDWIPILYVHDMASLHFIDLLNCLGDLMLAYGENEWTTFRKKPNDGIAIFGAKERRAVLHVTPFESWEIPQISVPPGEKWRGRWDAQQDPKNSKHNMDYYADESFGAGQTIFIMDDDYYPGHPEFAQTGYANGRSGPLLTRLPIQSLDEFPWGNDENDRADINHGTSVLSKVTGWQLGLAKKSQIIYVKNRSVSVIAEEKLLEMWVRTYNRIRVILRNDGTQQGKIIISSTSGLFNMVGNMKRTLVISRLNEIMKKLDRLGVVIIVAAHNAFERTGLSTIELGDDMSISMPDAFGNPANGPYYIENLIVVGGVDAMGRIAKPSPWTDWMVMAPSHETFAAFEPSTITGGHTGNSVAAPLVAGLVAYWRGLPNIQNGWGDELKDPANVKKLLLYMQRPIPKNKLVNRLTEYQVMEAGRRPNPIPFIWTGVHNGKNCLQNPAAHPSCPRDRIQNLVPNGASCQQSGSGARALFARADEVCVLRPGSANGNGPGQGALDNPITFTPGPASPTCNPGSPGCGTACTGFFCGPSPSGYPPGYFDPEGPSLPPLPEPTSCTGNQVTSTSTMCNGPIATPVCVTTKICVAPALTTTMRTSSTTTAAGPGPTDPNSAECKRCSSDLGASNCPAQDMQCLLDECHANTDCQKCNFDCDGIFDTTNPDGPECRQCGDDLGSSTCPADDEDCLVNECRTNLACQLCQFDCDGLFD
ncbi:hypothetical protein B0I35DRAFT_485623 [Stachybotrys elegans]|uniref:Peptidase S8/S53 domain-containing protein n=1 Tax=Stachybotrys elegans TaxID=80388 RepID=A0A8K0SFF8_9HYPO|nr:hypothetical protein B0I35DRAFT_485623 [Stachybotrys elegans]